jgi:hypothetical protein
MIFNDRTGDINYNKHGRKMIIEKYNSYSNIVVFFPDNNYRIHSAYGSFKNGEVSNPEDKTVLGTGYLGIGNFKSNLSKKILTPQYVTWSNMMERGYSLKKKIKFPNYKDVSVCEEWHNFQNFAKWYDENFYQIENEIMHFDKDILIKGNKIYSPETCMFVPARINTLFTKSNAVRGNYPIGVYHTRYNKYSTSCQDELGKFKYLGNFRTPEEAFYTYKKFKENVIKFIADKYKDKIPQKLYDAMYRYEVEITD